MSMMWSSGYLSVAAYCTCWALDPISCPAITCMYRARPCSVHSRWSASSGVAETVISSTYGYIASIASRTPGNGPHPCTMSAMAALTPSPHAIMRSAVSEGCAAANAAMPLSERGNSDSMNCVSSG